MGELLPLLRLHSDPRLMVIMISADDDFDPGDDLYIIGAVCMYVCMYVSKSHYLCIQRIWPFLLFPDTFRIQRIWSFLLFIETFRIQDIWSFLLFIDTFRI